MTYEQLICCLLKVYCTLFINHIPDLIVVSAVGADELSVIVDVVVADSDVAAAVGYIVED